MFYIKQNFTTSFINHSKFRLFYWNRQNCSVVVSLLYMCPNDVAIYCSYFVVCPAYTTIYRSCDVVCRRHAVVCCRHAVVCCRHAVVCCRHAVVCRMYTVVCRIRYIYIYEDMLTVDSRHSFSFITTVAKPFIIKLSLQQQEQYLFYTNYI